MYCLAFEGWLETLSRDSPDESQTGINVRVFPAFLQDRRQVLTATSTRLTRTLGRGSDLAIFPGTWTHSFCRLLLKAHPRAGKLRQRCAEADGPPAWRRRL